MYKDVKSFSGNNGLVRPEHEKNACGLGLIACLDMVSSHKIISQGLELLCNLEHRGAVGADPKAGDGAGILIQIPDILFRDYFAKINITLPPLGNYAVGQFFMPQNEQERQKLISLMASTINEKGYDVIGWREVPTDRQYLGEFVKPDEPKNIQLFITPKQKINSKRLFERKLFLLRHEIKNKVEEIQKQYNSKTYMNYYVSSFSSMTIVYKGIILGHNLKNYFLDLKDQKCQSGYAIVHQRYSTNTKPSWQLGHPYRMLCQNGEINTLRGNINWMRAREKSLLSELYSDDIKKLLPVSDDKQSDSAVFDNSLEFMVQGGYSLDEALMVMVPEPWDNQYYDQDKMKDFFRFNAGVMEPWDGPTAIIATDGRKICVRLDRNGLRPLRYNITENAILTLATEAGVISSEPEKLICQKRLETGQIFVFDIDNKMIVDIDQTKQKIASRLNYKKLLEKSRISIDDLTNHKSQTEQIDEIKQQLNFRALQSFFGYSQEEIRMLIEPMVIDAQEPIGAMGVDTAPAVLSSDSKILADYFKQKFAQVTNPPIDPLRETIVMSLFTLLGVKPNLFDITDDKNVGTCLELTSPILRPLDYKRILKLVKNDQKIKKENDLILSAGFIDTVIDVSSDNGFDKELENLCDIAEKKVLEGVNILILRDRLVSKSKIALPMLLCLAAVHYRLVQKGLRLRASIIVESAEPRQVHHICVLAGYGAEAIYPYLAFDTVSEIAAKSSVQLDPQIAVDNYCKALEKGILKVMSKMGVSTFQSYCGAQIFDIIGLGYKLTDKWFPYTANALGGIEMDLVEKQTRANFDKAIKKQKDETTVNLKIGSEYLLRTKGERHAWTFDSIASLQHAVRANAQEKYDHFASIIDNDEGDLINLRGLMRIKNAEETGRKKIPLQEVEPEKDIVKRFSTGAMSFGSISKEAHQTLAIAMNRISAKSNTGEGGEEKQRLFDKSKNNNTRSAIKQIASGRFGVTTEYLVNADMVQIKIAQGAKPGEGGQLPGAKIDQIIASVRHSTPGVTLISPPPHHDIYSIEDLAQLIFDIKNVNPQALVSVKLVALDGVGVVANGVAKAFADQITISGYDGGTGASPMTSIRHAGMPWEVNLAETQQALVENGLRERISLQVDGGLRTGRDVVIAALLGADEMGFATAPLIASGCIMMRKCHLNICPVGIATQDPVLRSRFKGKPEHVINYFFFVAQEIRQYLAEMGFSKLEQIIGKYEFLEKKNNLKDHRAENINLNPLFAKVENPFKTNMFYSKKQADIVSNVLDKKIIDDCKDEIERNLVVNKYYKVKNSDRSVGAMLSGYIVKKYAETQDKQIDIQLNLNGTAGQSLGAFLTKNITINLTGCSNDCLGKGLSGGRIIVKHPPNSQFDKQTACIAGNTILYGATKGEVFLAGTVGERFAIRNSGAITVVEGVGDHACEYMTGGVAMIIGKIGKNFAAGMSGGIAYLYDPEKQAVKNCNLDMVLIKNLVKTQNSKLNQEQLFDKYNMLDHDFERIITMLELHYRYTDSQIAKYLLDNRDSILGNFIKIVPLDFEKAVKQMKDQQKLQDIDTSEVQTVIA